MIASSPLYKKIKENKVVLKNLGREIALQTEFHFHIFGIIIRSMREKYSSKLCQSYLYIRIKHWILQLHRLCVGRGVWLRADRWHCRRGRCCSEPRRSARPGSGSHNDWRLVLADIMQFSLVSPNLEPLQWKGETWTEVKSTIWFYQGICLLLHSYKVEKTSKTTY